MNIHETFVKYLRFLQLKNACNLVLHPSCTNLALVNQNAGIYEPLGPNWSDIFYFSVVLIRSATGPVSFGPWIPARVIETIPLIFLYFLISIFELLDSSISIGRE